MTQFEIPTAPRQQTISVALPTKVYKIRFGYADVEDGGWFIDISDENGKPIICGIPLVTGCDLLGQHRSLGIPGRLWVTTDGDPEVVPTFDSLGVTSHLLFEPF